jgi:hypothetical protein
MSNEQHNLREELWVAGHELKDTITRLVSEGNARRLIVWSEEGKKLLEIPLSGGLAVGGAVVLLAPFIAGIVALAAVVKKVRVEVIRDPEEPKAGS